MADWETKIGRLRAVLFNECGAWAAQILEFDLAAQGRTKADVRRELGRIVVAHIAASAVLERTPFDGINEAPHRFWERFELGSPSEFVGSEYTIPGRDLPPIGFEVRTAPSRKRPN